MDISLSRCGSAIAAGLISLAALAAGNVAHGASLHTAEVEVEAGAVIVEQGGTATGSLSFSARGAISCTTGYEDPPATITLDSAYALDPAGEVSSAEPAVVSFTSDASQKGGSSNCGVTWEGAPAPYVQPIKVSADPATPLGDYTLDIDQEIKNSPDTGSSGKLGGASTTLAVRVVPPTPDPPPPVELPPAAQEVLGVQQVPPLRPDLGKTVLLAPVSGRVLARIGGRTVPLTEEVEVPNGVSVDATRGVLKVTVEADAQGTLQFANAWGGGFKVKQAQGAAPLTTFHLAGALKATRARTASASATKRRRLWVNGKGRFSSRGRRASAIVRGTQWLTEEVSAGTRVRVRTGVVRVRDMTLRRTVTVNAGESYLARIKRASTRRAPAFTGRAR